MEGKKKDKTTSAIETNNHSLILKITLSCYIGKQYIRKFLRKKYKSKLKNRKLK